VIEEGQSEAAPALTPEPVIAEGVVGGVLAVIHARLAQEHARRLMPPLNPLMGLIVAPYGGPDAAAQEVARPTPNAEARSELVRTPFRGSTDPLRGVRMRMTYRTVRVITAIAEQPGVSNRAVANAADIVDPGQASKILARLRSLGLINNSGKTRRGRHAWHLTALGKEVERAIRIHPQAGP
jgi:hypothetical protein